MIKTIFMMLFTIFVSLNAQAEVYAQLHDEIKEDIDNAKKLEKSPYFVAYKNEVAGMESCLKNADAYLEKSTDVDLHVYLKKLRKCEEISKKFGAHYVAALRESITKEDRALFQQLIETSPRILQHDRWVEKSVTYYKESRAKAPFKAGEKLLRESAKEDNYRQMAAMEMENYESNVKVLSYEQARKSRDKEGKVRTFFMGYKKSDGQTTLIAENSNAYPVTLLVKLDKVQNFAVDRPMPYHIEVNPDSRTEVMHLRVRDGSRPASFRSSYSWAMGRASARHDADFLYALPFERNALAVVSQGFNGHSTHTGSSKYAVDFVAGVADSPVKGDVFKSVR